MCLNTVDKEILISGRLCGTLFNGRIVGCTPKVSICPTSIMNEKSYEYINMDNIQLV